ncbi:MAG TPA: metallophosphoesterase [Byssovorax sp.]|jgi:3',5'-cyclic AMP phosphodiesterase CpdA
MSPALTIALISDLHFGPETRWNGKLRKLTHHAGELARAFVARMNDEVKPDLVVNLGDDIEDESLELDRARYAECQSILRSAAAELVNVAGNHDDVNLPHAELLTHWRRDGELYTSVDRQGFHFVVLHTRERKDHDVSIGAEQLAWLEADLAVHAGPTVVLMHHPASEQVLVGNRWFEGRAHVCLVRERRAIRRLFAQHGRVLAVFNGHVHWNHVDVIDGLPFVTVQSLVENLDDDAPGRPAAAHAVVRLTERRVIVEVEGAERARYQFDRRANEEPVSAR